MPLWRLLCRLCRLRNPPCLEEGFQGFTTHGSIDRQVGHLHHAGEFFQHEKTHAVFDQAEPVMIGHQRTLFIAELELVAGRLEIARQQCTELRLAVTPEEAVQSQRFDALADVEDIGAFNVFNTFKLWIHYFFFRLVRRSPRPSRSWWPDRRSGGCI